jgi:hypothetical protein
LVTNVSRQTLGHICKGSTVAETSVITNLGRQTSQKGEDLIYNAAETKNHELNLVLSFSRPGIYIVTWMVRGIVFLKDEERVVFSK